MPRYKIWGMETIISQMDLDLTTLSIDLTCVSDSLERFEAACRFPSVRAPTV